MNYVFADQKRSERNRIREKQTKIEYLPGKGVRSTDG